MTHLPKRKRYDERPAPPVPPPVEEFDLAPEGFVRCPICLGTGRAANVFYAPSVVPDAFPFLALSWPSHQACGSCGGQGWVFDPDYHPVAPS